MGVSIALALPSRTEKRHDGSDGARRARALAVAVACLAALPFLAAGLGGASFIDLDDATYVFKNPRVLDGLTPGGVRWAFSTFTAGNWHPLTWLSHMADISLFGPDAGRHHLVSILIHAVNAALLFLALQRMTGATWRSAFAAALFGVHPLHVESVAWVAERKDVLSGLFFMLVLLAYERYAREGGRRRYLAVALLLALGLMAKPMLVTLPFVLLLLDVWPLRRAGGFGRDGERERPATSWGRLIAEKAPLLALAAASAALTAQAQPVAQAHCVTADVRAANALISYLAYLGKTVWPSGLGVFYPHSFAMPPWWQIGGALIALVLASAAALLQLRRRPFLAAGWFWFLGMMVPVAGLLQVGGQARADRYTYLPLIGIFVAAAWALAHLAGDGRWRRPALGTISVALLAALSAAATVQAGYWRNSEALFRRTLAVAPDNVLILNNLASTLALQRRFEEAAVCYAEAVRMQPLDAGLRWKLGNSFLEAGRNQEAIAEFREVLRLQPRMAPAHLAMGVALAKTGRLEEAVAELRESLRLQPGDPQAHENLAAVLTKLGRSDEAARHRVAARSARAVPAPTR